MRIEDIDIRRCKREFETAILDDLKWLGFDWDGEVRRQSEHFATYGKALDQLDARGLIYPCFCSRADDRARAGGLGQRATRARRAALSRHLSASVGRRSGGTAIAAGQEHCLRLDAGRAAKEAGPYHFFDETLGRVEGEPLLMGDFVIARKDTPTSYHLAVTVDDHLQGITLVTRGVDVLPSTHVHGLLQKLLGYETPRYAHHKLLTDASGRRFAKRDRDMTIRAMREGGMTAEQVVEQALRWARHDLPDARFQRAHDHERAGSARSRRLRFRP